MASEKELLAQLQEYGTSLAQSLARARYWHSQALQAIQNEHDTREVSLNQQHTKAIQNIRTHYELTRREIQGQLTTHSEKFGWGEREWNSDAWENYQATGSGDVETLVRFGTLDIHGKLRNLTNVPALTRIINGQNLVIKAQGKGKENARRMMQSVILHLLAAIPAGKLRLVCIDPVGLGSTVAGFTKDLPPSITGGQAWFSPNDIEQRLTDLENHMAFVKQKYLGISFPTMEEYNRQAGQIEEPYRLLVVCDFPARFSESAAQHLLSITTNGPSTGVFTLMMVDTDQKQLPHNFNLQDIERNAEVVVVNDEGCKWQPYEFAQYTLTLDEPPPVPQFEYIVKNIATVALTASNVVVPFESVIPPPDQWWQGDSRAKITVPVGQFGARESQYFTLDNQLQTSALIVGKAGSGKSTLLHAIIHGVALLYPPDEVELYLLDFKQVEFKDYANHFLPHVKVVAVKSEREFGLSVLRGLDAELQRRKDLFGNITSLRDYRNQTGMKLPRLVLIADEFQELFSYDDQTASEAGLIIDRLVRQGRAFGVNILLASQTLMGGRSIPPSTKNQIPIRVALQCSDSDSREVLSDDNDRARLLQRPGEAIYNAMNGLVEGNNRFQVFWLGDDSRRRLLTEVRERANAVMEYAHRIPIIFDGDSPAELEQNTRLLEVLSQTVTTNKPSTRMAAWLGAPIEIKSHTEALFLRQSRSNLIIVGQNEYEENVLGILFAAVVGLAAQLPKPTPTTKPTNEPPSFLMINLSDASAEWIEYPDKLQASLPHQVKVVRRRPDVIAVIRSLHQEVQKRLQATDDTVRPTPHFLVIVGLHRARMLQEQIPESNAEFAPQISVSELLFQILRDGPDVGIHTLAWTDSKRALEPIFGYNRAEEEFGMRVILQMSESESQTWVDSGIGAKLERHRAAFYDADRGGRVEKFRPYRTLTPTDLEIWGKRLRPAPEL